MFFDRTGKQIDFVTRAYLRDDQLYCTVDHFSDGRLAVSTSWQGGVAPNNPGGPLFLTIVTIETGADIPQE